MGTVTFTDNGDHTLTAEVWSPGPRKRTVWARTSSGEWVVINVDTRTRVAPLTDPRFEPCPGHTTYVDHKPVWHPGEGTRLDCARYCRETARGDYVRLFRINRRDFTLTERARLVALFVV